MFLESPATITRASISDQVFSTEKLVLARAVRNIVNLIPVPNSGHDFVFIDGNIYVFTRRVACSIILGTIIFVLISGSIHMRPNA